MVVLVSIFETAIFFAPICLKTKEKALKHNVSELSIGPSVEIRTQGLLNPIQARYQTSPHPDLLAAA